MALNSKIKYEWSMHYAIMFRTRTRRKGAWLYMLSSFLIVIITQVFLVTSWEFGDKCQTHIQCRIGNKKWVCKPRKSDDASFLTSDKICRCPKINFEWVNGDCIDPALEKSNKSKQSAAELLTIIVPVIAATFLTFVIAIGCCCWAQNSTSSLKEAHEQKLNCMT